MALEGARPTLFQHPLWPQVRAVEGGICAGQGGMGNIQSHQRPWNHLSTLCPPFWDVRLSRSSSSEKEPEPPWIL
jgi:hypothetical protein